MGYVRDWRPAAVGKDPDSGGDFTDGLERPDAWNQHKEYYMWNNGENVEQMDKNGKILRNRKIARVKQHIIERHCRIQPRHMHMSIWIR